MKLETHISITASPEKIWQILTDFSQFKSWNPFLVYIIGKIRPKAHLIVVARLPKFILKFFPIIFHCQISNLKENKELRWKGKLLHSVLFQGEHFFILEEKTEGKVHFLHGEEYSGILRFLIVPLISSQKGFEMMNEALKKQCEL